ncbi:MULTISPECIES: chemotaxis response regulator protein-glutamate methylesterase [Actinosynnema]|uniref:protein-glutamate methylesterase/protein-glutamine glutaminase n=1 Tax=Actinosynnema TaxID=40566 RepID=UPI0020A2E78F|nr:chemotaxis response regulator protein-glutamate methylesterase [Actinosynnema pretiosum]MCP2099503.1 two-component system, chemotaxis family, response regulator CheB [Actinosynnema pretiosum]
MISVLVVDDSVVIRRLVADVLSADPNIRVVGTAANGKIALTKIDQLQPDIITLDVEMPIMDGVTTVRELRKKHPRLPVIMFSTLTSVGADATLAALAAGASDYVTKPANVGSISESISSVREQLLPRIHALCGRPKLPPPPARRGPVGAPPVGGPPARPGTPARPGAQAPARPGAPVGRGPGRPSAPGIPGGHNRVDVLAIGSSTGGPEALRVVLSELPANLPVPVVVVQHMPPVFTAMLAQRLDAGCKVKVVEATAGTPLRPGTVYLAPGDKHLEVVRAGTNVQTKLHNGPQENHCRPAVDVLFRSVASVYGGNVLAVVLTGMGHDGRAGAQVLRAKGARIAAQDEFSSVVWGMPGSVVEAGLADDVLPLSDMTGYILSQLPDRVAATAPGVA